jgi:uncharacterized protein (TIGR03437 family)
MVRSVDRRVSSAAQNIRLTRNAPGIIVNPETKQAAVYDAETGEPVTKERPTTRDRYLTIYGTGFGAEFDRIPLDADVDDIRALVKVFIGDPTIREAEMDVRWAGAVPGLVGIYQVNIYVPWYRLRGEQPVFLRVTNVSSQTAGPVVPRISVD